MLSFEKDEWALFKGIEQEGPLKGSPTLFVVGDVPELEIEKELPKENYLNLYFGAGHRSKWNYKTIEAIISWLPTGMCCIPNITIESAEINLRWLDRHQRKYIDLTFGRKGLWWILPIICADDGPNSNAIAKLERVKNSHIEHTNILLKIDWHKKVHLMTFPSYLSIADWKDYGDDRVIVKGKTV